MRSWNRYPVVHHADTLDVTDLHSALPATNTKVLPFGNGRSYGDVCLNEDGTLLRTRRSDRFISFDRSSGRLACEAGVLLSEILELVVPQGWFLRVTPGTRYVTVGGAIGNDVHGKNHHVEGSFGHHVRRFELLRSDGERMLCSPKENPDWFAATVGGMGLTGIVTWAELQLLRISNPFMVSESVRFENLKRFWDLNSECEARWPYTVAWIDCVATGKRVGRGIMMLGRHAPPQRELPAWKEKNRNFVVDPPFSLVNKVSLRAFNALYYRRRLVRGLSHYVPYFYPLDGIKNWNRMYGRKGFFQYQCVFPPEASRDGVSELLKVIGRWKAGSFLAVLKTFGARPSVGMLSFPRPGATLALDFPNKGARTLRLFNELDAVVREAAGALYPAKDARMPGELFRAAYPQWSKFESYIDPQFSSSFWRRVME